MLNIQVNMSYEIAYNILEGMHLLIKREICLSFPSSGTKGQNNNLVLEFIGTVLKCIWEGGSKLERKRW